MVEPVSLTGLVLVAWLEVALCFPSVGLNPLTPRVGVVPGFVVALLYIILYIYINFFPNNFVVKTLCKKYLKIRAVRGGDTKDNTQVSSDLKAITGK